MTRWPRPSRSSRPISPQRTFIYAEKLQELGVLKNKAASWKDYFFEEAHGGNGSRPAERWSMCKARLRSNSA